jgi:uncharacterized protein (DUF1800 family)
MADRTLIAHLLRRTSFGPFPGQVESFDGLSYDEAVSRVMEAAPLQLAAPDVSEGNDDRYGDMTTWWPTAMVNDGAGLHEKMTFFWHSLFTSSINKCDIGALWRQHELLRQYALGNVRELLQKITLDAAMLQYLDGNGSSAEAPNENYSRELMELFALGRGAGYTETDVRAGARALAGYWVDGEKGMLVVYEPDMATASPVWFLGRQVSTAEEVVNTVVDHEACAPYLVGRLHHFLVGAFPSDERRAELAAILRDTGFETYPVVENILRSSDFQAAQRNRSRTPLEWYASTSRFFDNQLDTWVLNQMGMVPFDPPNVAGWPPGRRWFSTGAAFTWAAQAYDNAWDTQVVDVEDPITAVAERAGIYDLSVETRTTIEEALNGVDERRARASLIHMLIAVSPEFVTA